MGESNRTCGCEVELEYKSKTGYHSNTIIYCPHHAAADRYQAERDAARSTLRNAMQTAHENQKMWGKAQDEVELLRAAVEAVANKCEKGFTFCAYCNQVNNAGHKQDCVVGAALTTPKATP